MVLILDQEYQHVLTQPILIGRHVVLRMRDDARLEDSSKISSCHPVEVRLGSKDSQQIEDVE